MLDVDSTGEQAQEFVYTISPLCRLKEHPSPPKQTLKIMHSLDAIRS